MNPRSGTKWWIVLIAGAVALTPILASAASGPDVIPPTQMSCTMSNGTTLTAVAAANGDFPRVLQCPDTAGECAAVSLSSGGNGLAPGQYLAWDYQWTNATQMSQTLLSLSSDISLLGAVPSGWAFDPPGTTDSTFKIGGLFDAKLIRFNAQATTVSATYYTPLGIQPVPTTTASKVGSNIQTCTIAGAGALTGLPENKQAINVAENTQAGNCLVSRTLDNKGHTTSITILSSSNSANCRTTDVTLQGTTPSGNTLPPSAFISPQSQITFGTNTYYCWPNSWGGCSCVYY